MRLVIWGAGFRGKALVSYLGKEYVAAIIESDIGKVGQKYKDVEIISFEKYKQDYCKLAIIITPEYQFQEEICQVLMQQKIFHFFYSSELPPSIRYDGKVGLECYQEMITEKKEIYFYGLNAFSLVLYLYLKKYKKNISFVLDKNSLKENQKAIVDLLQLTLVDKKEFGSVEYPIYITTHEYIADINTMFSKHTVIDAFRYADIREEYRNLELKRFHNMYANKKRCFIVATGPSLTVEDLSVLLEHKEFCFSVNSMCKNQLTWKPDVYVVSDGKFFSENQEIIKNYECPIKILPDDRLDYWNRKRDGEYHIHRNSLDAYDILEFSEDITQILNTQGTVTVGCIQIAVYMGIKEIYLLGTDCNYQMGSKNNHFGGDSKPDVIDHSISSMLKGYQMCKEYADSHGIKIYNATRGGMLEVFERVDFDSLF